MLTELSDNVTVRKFHPRKGRFLPSARFCVDKMGRVAMFFNYQTLELFGVGAGFKSADLSHLLNHNTGEEHILFEMFPDPEQGHRRITLLRTKKAIRIYITEFIRDQEISFMEHHRYSVTLSGNCLYLNLGEAKPIYWGGGSELKSA